MPVSGVTALRYGRTTIATSFCERAVRVREAVGVSQRNYGLMRPCKYRNMDTARSKPRVKRKARHYAVKMRTSDVRRPCVTQPLGEHPFLAFGRRQPRMHRVEVRLAPCAHVP